MGSDEEYYEEEEVEDEEEEYEDEEYEEEEEEEAEEVKQAENKSVRSAISQAETGDGNFLKARQEAKKGELDEHINEWRKQRAKEEEELKRLKEKQAKRKEIRAEQE